MSKLDDFKKAITLLEGQDIDALKQALTIVGEPVIETKSAVSAGDLPFEVGKSYLIRTVTYFQVGRITSISGGFIVMEDASWIPDTGRFADTLKTGNFNEVEPVGAAIVSVNAIVDAFPFTVGLPKVQK